MPRAASAPSYGASDACVDPDASDGVNARESDRCDARGGLGVRRDGRARERGRRRGANRTNIPLTRDARAVVSEREASSRRARRSKGTAWVV